MYTTATSTSLNARLYSSNVVTNPSTVIDKRLLTDRSIFAVGLIQTALLLTPVVFVSATSPVPASTASTPATAALTVSAPVFTAPLPLSPRLANCMNFALHRSTYAPSDPAGTVNAATTSIQYTLTRPPSIRTESLLGGNSQSICPYAILPASTIVISSTEGGFAMYVAYCDRLIPGQLTSAVPSEGFPTTSNASP